MIYQCYLFLKVKSIHLPTLQYVFGLKKQCQNISNIDLLTEYIFCNLCYVLRFKIYVIRPLIYPKCTHLTSLVPSAYLMSVYEEIISNDNTLHCDTLFLSVFEPLRDRTDQAPGL